MSENVLELTDANFATEVLQSDVPVVVDFWAPWCGPCRQLTPTIEALAEELAGKAKVGKLNTDENSQTSAAYQISGIPTVLVFKGGEVVDRHMGLVPKPVLQQAIEAHL